MLRLLHIINNLNYGGMERVLVDLVLRTSMDRFESHVLCLRYLGRYAHELKNVCKTHLARPMNVLSMVRPSSLAEEIARIKPDVVHTHSGVWFKASLAARIADVPLVVHTDHGRARPDPLGDRVVDSIAARRTDVVVAVSDALGEQINRTLYIPEEKIRVVRNGVDTDNYAPSSVPSEVRASLGISPDTPVIGSIGRLEPIKGYDVMVEAFARLVKMWEHPGPAPVLVLAGEGSVRKSLEKLAAEYQLGDRIRFLGWRDDSKNLYASFNLFTMSSRSEGTSISLLEAMSMGLCPVVTEVGGNPAVLGPALAHRMVPSENPDALAKAWIEALVNVGRRDADGLLGRQLVIDNFSLLSMVRQYEEIYATGGR